MSATAISFAAENALPLVRPLLTTIGVAIMALRPLLTFGVAAVFLWVFKPLLRGIARAALMIFTPRQSLAVRAERRALRSVRMLNSMARDYDTQQPNLAAELRMLASRG